MIILLARLSFHMSFYMVTSTEFSHDHSSRTTEFSPEFFMINSTNGFHMSLHMINRLFI